MPILYGHLCLSSVNNKLQQREAAQGVLLYAKKKIIDVKDGKDSVSSTIMKI